MELRSAIFDMDGVITDTAQVHFKAWKQIFDHYLQEEARRKKTDFVPFTLDDYVQYVDGLSRIDGIKYFLRSRNLLSLDKITPQEEELIDSISQSKNKLFLDLINEEGVSVFDGTINLIKELKANNIHTAAISSSKNAHFILKKAKVINLFDAIVDGQALIQYHLKGKPDPDIFLEAAKRISAIPEETVVVEDALSGIIAGKKGQFGLVIGIDRRNKWHAEFKQQGADIVVSDLSELKLDQIKSELKKNPRSALNSFHDIVKLLNNKHFLLFCDYDGTLTPIVKRPELAIISKEMKDLLFQLKQFCHVIIVSGRQLADIENMVGINGLYYAGNHGLEIIGPEYFATTFEKGIEFIDSVQKCYQEIIPKLSGIENYFIENKKFSLSVHYRLVNSEQILYIEKILDEIIKGYPGLIKRQGKMVFEIRPNIAWNKGSALRFLLSKLSNNDPDVIPLYIGDDTTDEDAFFEIKDYGIGVLVTENLRQTYASYYLNNPNEVYYFLKQLLAVVQTRKVIEHREKNWLLTYSDYEPEREKLREALCTLGNGYFASRGAGEESIADKYHYPGTYFAGCYNRLESIIEGKEIYNEDLVNMPNWLPITFKHKNDEEWYNLDNIEILDYRQELNLKKGLLQRSISIKDQKGRVTHLNYQRFISMANPHVAGQMFQLKPGNWSGEILIKSGLDGSVINSGVDRYKELNSKHLDILKIEDEENNQFSLLTRTNQSHIEVAYTLFQELFKNHQKLANKPEIEKNPQSIYAIFHCHVNEYQTLILEKRLTVAKNNDVATSDCLTYTKNLMFLVKKKPYHHLLEEQFHAWRNIWKLCDIKIQAQGEDQRILRLHIFHLLQTVSHNSIRVDTGIPARGLHGESYRGHIFWDELFIIPFYNFYFPQMARSLLLYRYYRLDMARLLAVRNGYQGAMYPWQSASNGDEVTQTIHLNPRSHAWVPDYSHYQRHVNAAIVYNIWQYYLATGDKSFLCDYGAEMVFEIARFWASIVQFNPIAERYEINHVVGPDEYHEKYPYSDQEGINNNAYTNVMAVWSIERALEILSLLPSGRCEELKEKLQLHDKEIAYWFDITLKMKIPFHDNDIISQFDGYEQLPEFNWDEYIAKYGNIERLDRILKAENDSSDNYKVSKQADVLMLLYLFSYEELHSIFTKLGYLFNEEILLKNIYYYLRRTSHGSTLSKVVIASLYRYINPEIALKYYQEVLDSDLLDLQGGTTHEGIHLGAMASTIFINLRCFAGIDIKHGKLSFSPRLPARINMLNFNLQFHQQWLEVLVTRDRFEIELGKESTLPLSVIIQNRECNLQPGCKVVV